MWREKLARLSTDIAVCIPATAKQIAAAEHVIGRALPEHLRSLLLETDGVLGQYSLSLVWKAERIASDNQLFRTKPEFRELYMPFDSLLFFGAGGNGDQFAFPIRPGEVRKSDVFVWNHENDNRTWVAPSLEKYLEWFISGKIKV